VNWRLSPDEFRHVWGETDLDTPPEPLEVWSSYRMRDEAERAHAAIRAQYPPGADVDLSAALRILAAPDTRVCVVGGRLDGVNAVRVVGAAVRHDAALAVQEPGPTPDHGGAVHLWLGKRASLAGMVAGAFPPAPGGRVPALTAAARDLDDERRPVTVRVAAMPTRRQSDPAAEMRRLLAQPAVAQGAVRIETRRDAERPPAPVYLSWRDVARDGRYLISPNAHEVRLVPGSRDGIAHYLDRYLNPALQPR
jgi:hypothetical protein